MSDRTAAYYYLKPDYLPKPVAVVTETCTVCKTGTLALNCFIDGSATIEYWAPTGAYIVVSDASLHNLAKDFTAKLRYEAAGQQLGFWQVLRVSFALLRALAPFIRKCRADHLV